MATKITKSELKNMIREALREELSVSNYRRRAIREDVNDEQEVEFTDANIKKAVTKAILDKGGKAAADIAKIVWSRNVIISSSSASLEGEAGAVDGALTDIYVDIKDKSGEQKSIDEIATSVVEALRADAQKMVDLTNKYLQ